MGNAISLNKANLYAIRANIERKNRSDIEKLTHIEGKKMILEKKAIINIEKKYTEISPILDEIKKSYVSKFSKDNTDISREDFNENNSIDKDNIYVNNMYVNNMYDSKNNDENVYIYTFSLNFSLLKEELNKGNSKSFDTHNILDSFILHIPTVPLEVPLEPDQLKTDSLKTESLDVPLEVPSVPDPLEVPLKTDSLETDHKKNKLIENLELLLLYLYECHIISIIFVYKDNDKFIKIYKDIRNSTTLTAQYFYREGENQYLILAKAIQYILSTDNHDGFIQIELSNKEKMIPIEGGGKKTKRVNRKEILGKERCIYKKVGDRKEYVKHKGDLITVKDYKRIIKAKNNKRK
jgi:hypothetical protein